jgi:acetyl esterase/lipase
MLWLLIAIAAFFVFSYVYLRGENLAYLDRPVPRHPVRAPSPALRAALDTLAGFTSQPLGRGRERIRRIRSFMDDMGHRDDYAARFVPLAGGDVRGEWVLAEDHSNTRRILYIHGGAYFAGSPRSHRPITEKLALMTGCAVLAVDYRLMPEHPRLAGLEDCQRAWRWLIDNGPDGPEVASRMVVAGDSAGGNLTLALIAWIRDAGLRQADAAVALSPATDAVLDAPSLTENVSTDAMLGPAFGFIARVPRILRLWYTLATTRLRPSDPRISPLRGSLAGLPPTLIHASDSEMLLDDARRYAAKAQAAESPVELQTWPDMLHVWHIFRELPESEEAYARIGEFLARHDVLEASAAA